MLDWIMEGIVTWVSGIVAQIMDAVSGVFLNALGTDMTAMEEYFPFVSKAFDVLQYFSWALLFLITVWQFFRIFGGPITEAESPLPLLARSALFALLIGYAKPIFEMVLDIARAPYTALMDLSMTAEDFTFVGIEAALKNGLTTIISVVSIVGLLLLVILEIALGWNYFKLLLETVERYIVVGVLCYTSPLAFSMGASKATSNVFKSWCRMVGSQLLLLVMNVWFLRAFNSSMGQFTANGGALTNGHGNIFLWLFCALAFLKTAQRFDSYLASLGLNVAQTGSSMGMELLMAARVLSGVSGSVKGSGGVARGSAATGTGAAATGFMSNLSNKFKGNSYVRDAVVSGGEKMGAGGTVGFIGRAFGGIAARNGAALTGESIASVASRTPNVSGMIGGEIADRSLKNYMPQLGGYSLSGTQITGGQITTTATGPNGKSAEIRMFSADQFEKPEVPHSLVSASDGSKWYQMAEGGGSEAFFPTPMFNGTASEAEQVAASFPDAAEGTMLRTADEGVIEATSVGFGSRLYNSSCYSEPEGEHSVITASDGSQWYQVPSGEPAPQPIGQAGEEVTFPDLPDGTAVTPAGIGMMEATGENSSSMLYNSEFYAEPEGNYELITASDGSQWYSVNEGAAEVPPLATQDGGLTFAGMPEDISATPVGVGVAEAVDGNGVSSMLYNSAYYGEPEGDYSVVTDTNGNQWYQVAEGNAAPQLTGDNVTFPEMPNTTSVSFAGAGMAEAVSEDGSTAMLYNSAYYGEPESDYSLVTASDGSQWYQLAQGAEAPQLIGGNESMTFSGASDMTVEQTGVGIAEAVDGDGASSMLYNSAYYGEPNGDYSLVTGSDGSQWYQLSQDAEAPQLIGGGELSFPDMPDASVSQTGVGVAEAVNEDGSRAVLYSSEYYGKPESGEYGTVTAADGSQWYQISASEQAEPPRFKGDPAEGVSFSGMPENTEVQSVGSGVVEARSGNENNTLWYSSAHFEEPAAPHTVIQETNGTEWYAMQPHAPSPNFEQGDAAAAYNQAQLSAFLPGYEQKVTSVDGSARFEGRIEVRHENGSGTMFYDTTRYSAPRGDYRVYEDVNGNQWYAVKGDASVERKPVYEDGKPVYDGDNIKTVSVDTVKYKSNPAKYEAPKRRGIFRIKPPRRRK